MRRHHEAVYRRQIQRSVCDKPVSLHHSREDEEEFHSRQAFAGALPFAHSELHHSFEKLLKEATRSSCQKKVLSAANASSSSCFFWGGGRFS